MRQNSGKTSKRKTIYDFFLGAASFFSSYTPSLLRFFYGDPFQWLKKIEIKNKRTKEQETKSIPTKSPHAYSYHRFCNFSMYISHRKVARMSQMVSCGPFLSTLFLHHPLSFPPPSILSHLLVFFRSLRNRKSEESHPKKTLHIPVGTKMEVSIPLRRREKKKKLIYGFCCGHICALLQFTTSLRFCYFVPLKAMNL